MINQVFETLQRFFGGTSYATLGAFFFSTLLFIVVTAWVLFGGKWRGSVLALPLTAWFFLMFALGTGLVSRIIVEAVLLSVLIVEVVLFIGPFRVSAWAWPDGVKPKTPRRVFVVLLVAAIAAGMGTAIVSYCCGYLLLFGRYSYAINGIYRINPWHFSGWVILDQLEFGVAFSCLLYFTFWGLYVAGLSCFSLHRQTCRARLADCQIRLQVASRSSGGQPLIFFENDPNSYMVSRSFYKKLEQHIGETYCYTVITSFNHRQFIRQRPQRISG